MFEGFKLNRPDLTVAAEHDGRHKLDPSKPKDRESIPYIVNIPDEEISFFTYTWVNSAHEAGAAISIFGPSIGPEPLTFGLPDRKIDPGMDFSDWQIENFSMKHDLQWQHAECSFANDQVELNFTFDAYHPPYAYSAHKDGCPPYCADDRTEQSGRAKGTLKVNGRTIEFDAGAHRDHSWGTRDWFAFRPGYRWFVGQVGNEISLHFWDLSALGQPQLRGYVAKDGLMAEITDLESSWTLDEEFFHRTLEAKITDEAGRTTDLKAEFYAQSLLVPSDEVTLREGGARIWVDGKEGSGWMEFAWATDYLEHVLSVPEYGQLQEG